MILVTGARGQIGSGLVNRLKKRNIETISMIRSPDFSAGKNEWSGDLCRIDHIKKMEDIADVPDVVIHLAGFIGIVLKKDNKNFQNIPVPDNENIHEIYSNNVISTANILQYCIDKKVRHLIFASSQTVYGIPSSPIVSEGSPLRPLEHYALSKAICENILKFAEKENISVTILRFPGIYSEKRKSGAVYTFCKNALSKKEIQVTSDIPIPFDIIHLEDILNALECVILHPPDGFEIFNIATGEPCSLTILADAVASLVPECHVVHSETPQPVIQLDSTKAFRVLGWRSVPRAVRLQSMLDAIRHDG